MIESQTKLYGYLLCGLLAGIGGLVYLLHTGAGAPERKRRKRFGPHQNRAIFSIF
jgi:ribose/xylose/arabinose/galactoside ABC-type transport system permease subunit